MPKIKDEKNSFLNNLLDCISNRFLELRQAEIDTEKLVIFDNNSGKQLDRLGSDFNETRNGEDDTKFLARIKLASDIAGTIGDENTIVKTLASYLGIEKNEVIITNIGTRKILVELPDAVDQELVKLILLKIKAAGIIVEVQYSKYWEDFTYDQLATKTYAELEKYRYERGGKRRGGKRK